MSDQWQAAECRLLDLLADQATFGLSRIETEELGRLTQMVPDFDIECMERAAAVVNLALVSVEPLPAAISKYRLALCT